MRKLAIGILVTIALAGCGDSGDQNAPVAGEDHALTEAVHAVCDARDAVGDSIEPSWRIFQNRAHDALHELARQVTEESRPAAATLLEAKQRVEVAFVKDMDTKGFRKLMSQLFDASNDALDHLSLPRVGCA